MRVMIDQQETREIESNYQSLDEWWKMATAQVAQRQRLIYCVQVNDKTIFDGYEQFMIANLDELEAINVTTLSKAESIQQTEEELDEYLDRFLPASIDVARSFYGDLTEKHWSQFSSFIQGLDWIFKALEFESELLKQEGRDLPEYLAIVNTLEVIVRELDSSLQVQNFVAVGDLIQYEIIPLLQNFRSRHRD
ncbi:hypothetical protein PSTEL_24985 [Paenibacillus stellifer]|uniref:Uncharacterized protein n=1 Tax=Paenibacillus stellifer TaxID=169760 RepID=A0A089NAL4_9BACL|nr:hypothetical protein [Paenibacillus stellifer]AIQ65879.1 hypothetical protein PSTEL_24985 [Paenibacillus stellifer]